MVWIDGEAGLTLTAEYAEGYLTAAEWTGTTYRTADCVMACDVALPESPTDGVLWEAGGSGIGACLAVRDSGTVLRLRAGTGGSLDPDGTAWIDIPVASLPFDGGTHRLVWELLPDDGRVRLFIDGWLAGEGTTASGGPLGYLGSWSGGAAGGYGSPSADLTVPTGEPTAAWSGDIVSDLRVYAGQRVIAVSREPDRYIYLAEISGADAVFRLATEAFIDLNAPGHYLDALMAVPSYRASLDAQRGLLTGGAASVTRGRAVILRGPDTDGIVTGKVAGRPFRLLRGPADGAYWQFVPVLAATCGRPAGYQDRIEVPLRGRKEGLQRSLIEAYYAGDNTGGAGLEGDESLKGQPKPRLFGRCWNLEPRLVNRVLGILQVSTDPGTVHSVKVGGIARTIGTAYSSYADLQDAGMAPSAGQARIYSGSEGLFVRLTGAPEGIVHVEAASSGTDSAMTPAALAELLLTEAGESIDADSADALATDFAHVTGLYTGSSDLTYAQALDLVLADAGAHWTETALGSIRLVQVPAPDTSASVLTLQEVSIDSPAPDGVADLQEWRLQPPSDDTAGNPVWQVTVKYRRNLIQMGTSSLFGDPTLPPIDEVGSPSTSPLNYDPVGGWGVRQALADPYATAEPVNDSGITDDYPLASEAAVETGLHTEAGAEALRDLLFARLSTERDFGLAMVPMDADVIERVQIGSVVTVRHSDFGYASGRAMVVVDMALFAEGEGGIGRQMQLTLWG